MPLLVYHPLHPCHLRRSCCQQPEGQSSLTEILNKPKILVFCFLCCFIVVYQIIHLVGVQQLLATHLGVVAASTSRLRYFHVQAASAWH